jgi:flavin-binding protein dodecin
VTAFPLPRDDRYFEADAVDERETPMNEHVYKMLELTGSSTTSIEDAVANAIRKAAKTVRKMQWFQILETRGHIAEGAVSHWQVTLKVGFTLED